MKSKPKAAGPRTAKVKRARTAAARATPRVLHWNGKDLPRELRGLPPGRYLVEVVDVVPELSLADEEALAQGLDEIDRGETVPWKQVRADLDATLKGR